MSWLNCMLVMILILVAGCTAAPEPEAETKGIREAMQELDRGRYVIVVMGCNDCHTPNYLVRRGNVPEEDWLVGSDLGFKGRNGTSYPTNLRLLVSRLTEEGWMGVAKKMRKGSPMADVMLPETAESDLLAIYRYLQYLGPKGKEAAARLPAGVIPGTPYIVSPGPH